MKEPTKQDVSQFFNDPIEYQEERLFGTIKEIRQNSHTDVVKTDNITQSNTVESVPFEKNDLMPYDGPIETIDGELISSVEAIINEPLVEEYKTESTTYEIQERQHPLVKIPRAIQNERFDLEKKLIGNRNIEVNIPQSFPFSYEEEGVIYGLLKLLSENNYTYHFHDALGFFPTSRGQQVFYIPIPRLKLLFEALGLRPKSSRVYPNADKLKSAFENLILYRHPVEIRRRRILNNGEGYYEHICILENLFQVCKCSHALDEKDLTPIEMERRPGGGWGLTGGLKDLVILLNPKVFNSNIVRNFIRFDSELYMKVENSRRRLSGGNGRGWKKQPQFLTFGYYLLRQGGRFGRNDDDVLYYRFERELGGLLRRLNLQALYKTSSRKALKVLERTFLIYKDIGYLIEYEFRRAKRGLKEKVVFYLNVSAFPHLTGSQEVQNV